MIAHKARDRRDRKSSVKTLARYILDAKNNGAKVEHQWTRNVLAGDDVELAIKEIQAVQELNTRAKTDKTYHLIISFRESDSPTEDQMKEIEQMYCEGLGYGQHQRLCTVHDDTDNTHIHVLINKVDPVAFTVKNPYYDYYALDRVSKKVEKVFGFAVDNRIDPDKTSKYKGISDDIVAHRGEEPFTKWCREELADTLVGLIEKSDTWQALHVSTLKDHGLRIKQRGAGIILEDERSGATCTLSSLRKGLGIKALQKKLGSFQKLDIEDGSHVPTLANPIRRNKLYEEFLHKRKAEFLDRDAAIKSLRTLQRSHIARIKSEYLARRSEIKLSGDLDWPRKKALYSLARMDKIRAIEETKHVFGRDMEFYRRQKAYVSWRDFLVEKSANGDKEALHELQRAKKMREPSSNSISCASPVSSEIDYILMVGIDYIVRPSGDVVYNFNEGAKIIDRGNRVDVFANSDSEIAKALILAKNKFGGKIKLSGSHSFIKKARGIASKHRISVLSATPSRREHLEKDR